MSSLLTPYPSTTLGVPVGVLHRSGRRDGSGGGRNTRVDPGIDIKGVNCFSVVSKDQQERLKRGKLLVVKPQTQDLPGLVSSVGPVTESGSVVEGGTPVCVYPLSFGTVGREIVSPDLSVKIVLGSLGHLLHQVSPFLWELRVQGAPRGRDGHRRTAHSTTTENPGRLRTTGPTVAV